MHIAHRNNVRVLGKPESRAVVFAHGFGCNQDIWREVVPHFLDNYQVVVFDHVGAGGSDLSAYDPAKYDSLDGYASDINEIFAELDLTDAVFVGHSVGAMMGALASIADPDRFGALVLVGPSPRYINDGDYIGGFTQADIDSMIDALDRNYLGWSRQMAPVIAGNAHRPEIGGRLTESFCKVDPKIARQFARVTFLSDNRDDLARVSVPTLVLQNSDDVIAPDAVGEYVHSRIEGSTLVTLTSSGHIPSLANPEALAGAIVEYLE